MDESCSLRLEHFVDTLVLAQELEYEFATCRRYAEERPEGRKVLVLRHDVDIMPERAPAMAGAEAEMGIAATYFFRVHANEYNAFGHENLALMRDLIGMGHEVGLHAEPLDLLASTGIAPEVGITVMATALSELLGTPVVGVASHNDVTPDNNLDFFRAVGAAELGLTYEAYDSEGLDLFARSWYVTDGHFWHWRAFDQGELTENRDCLCAHLRAERTPLYALIHPHVWYREHFHRVRY